MGTSCRVSYVVMPEGDDILAKLAQITDPLELTRGLFEHAPTPFAIFDDRGHCVLTNPAYRGYETGDVRQGDTFGARSL